MFVSGGEKLAKSWCNNPNPAYPLDDNHSAQLEVIHSPTLSTAKLTVSRFQPAYGTCHAQNPPTHCGTRPSDLQPLFSFTSPHSQRQPNNGPTSPNLYLLNISPFASNPLPTTMDPIPPHLTKMPPPPPTPQRTALSALHTLPNPHHPPTSPPPLNTTLFQAFEWYLPPPSPSCPSHWTLLTTLLPSLSTLGVSRIWIPPACKAASPHTNGYDIYDLYDLGEFEQKGSVRTKWGTKAELEVLVRKGEEVGVGVLFDAVLGHKAAADEKEVVRAVEVRRGDRRVAKKGDGGGEEEVEVIEAWTGYRFEGRGDMYSSMQWNKEHFTGIDWDDRRKREGIWRFEGKKWAEDVDEELGNYDYLYVTPFPSAEVADRWTECLPTSTISIRRCGTTCFTGCSGSGAR